MRRRTPDFLALGAILAHLLLGVTMRTIAWPEVTTPGYLWSRGLLLYRDVKFVHTPGTIGLLALVFALFGVGTGVVRVFALAFPMLAHWQLLRRTRSFSPLPRVLASAFFLVLLFQWQGNSVWPSALLTALALPIASFLARRRVAAAGILIGAAILTKQTAAYVLFLAFGRLFWERRSKEAWTLALCASVPFALAAGVFALLGSGGDYLRWTILVPFTVLKGVIDVNPGPRFLLQLGLAFAPLVLYTLREKQEDARREAIWLLVTAAGTSPRPSRHSSSACVDSLPGLLSTPTSGTTFCLEPACSRPVACITTPGSHTWDPRTHCGSGSNGPRRNPAPWWSITAAPGTGRKSSVLIPSGFSREALGDS